MKNFTLLEKYKRFKSYGEWQEHVTVHHWEHNETGVRLLEKQTTHKYRNRIGTYSQFHEWTIPGRGSASLKYWISRLPALARKVHKK